MKIDNDTIGIIVSLLILIAFILGFGIGIIISWNEIVKTINECYWIMGYAEAMNITGVVK